MQWLEGLYWQAWWSWCWIHHQKIAIGSFLPTEDLVGIYTSVIGIHFFVCLYIRFGYPFWGTSEPNENPWVSRCHGLSLCLANLKWSSGKAFFLGSTCHQKKVHEEKMDTFGLKACRRRFWNAWLYAQPHISKFLMTSLSHQLTLVTRLIFVSWIRDASWAFFCSHSWKTHIGRRQNPTFPHVSPPSLPWCC